MTGIKGAEHTYEERPMWYPNPLPALDADADAGIRVLSRSIGRIRSDQKQKCD